MGTDAASGWILDELEEGNKIPEASDYMDVKVREGGMVNLFTLDMDSYAEKHGIWLGNPLRNFCVFLHNFRLIY